MFLIPSNMLLHSCQLYVLYYLKTNGFVLYVLLQYKQETSSLKATPGELLLTSNNIRSLQDLHYFFAALSRRSSDTQAPLNITQLETVIEQDFLEKMPAAR